MKKIIFLILFLPVVKLGAQINPLSNKISLDISTMPQSASFDYDSCFALGVNLGMSSVGLHFPWTTIETAPGIYDLSLFDIANYYYPLHGMPVDLNINPLETNHLEVPADLDSLQYDDSVFIKRFKVLLDSVKAHIPDLSLSSLIIGSEGDVYMGSNASLWQQYSRFYDSIVVYAKTLWPGVKLACELTADGLVAHNTLAQTLNTNSDYIGVSYYPITSAFLVRPISTIAVDFDTLVNLYPTKPICFYQYGYPSSIGCNSSADLQKQFITQTFNVWDTYAANVRLIDFTWLHDLDTGLVSYYESYYGISDSSFLAFLGSLGLRTWNGTGTDKPAFPELECQAYIRGYNSLASACTIGVEEWSIEKPNFLIYPNPVNDIIILRSLVHDTKVMYAIYNMFGACLRQGEFLNEVQLNLSELSNGFYNLVLNGTTLQSFKVLKQ